MTAPIFTPGQTIKLTQELELEQEDGYLHILPVGTEVTITAVFPEYWNDFGAVNMDVSYEGDVERVDHYDHSGQSDWTERSTGVANIDFDPNA